MVQSDSTNRLVAGQVLECLCSKPSSVIVPREEQWNNGCDAENTRPEAAHIVDEYNESENVPLRGEE